MSIRFRPRRLLPLAAIALAAALGGCVISVWLRVWLRISLGLWRLSVRLQLRLCGAQRWIHVRWLGPRRLGSRRLLASLNIAGCYNPARSRRRIARAQACARGTRLSSRRNSSGRVRLAADRPDSADRRRADPGGEAGIGAAAGKFAGGREAGGRGGIDIQFEQSFCRGGLRQRQEFAVESPVRPWCRGPSSAR